jgi:hypothetical protein
VGSVFSEIDARESTPSPSHSSWIINGYYYFFLDDLILVLNMTSLERGPFFIAGTYMVFHSFDTFKKKGKGKGKKKIPSS